MSMGSHRRTAVVVIERHALARCHPTDPLDGHHQRNDSDDGEADCTLQHGSIVTDGSRRA